MQKVRPRSPMSSSGLWVKVFVGLFVTATAIALVKTYWLNDTQKYWATDPDALVVQTHPEDLADEGLLAKAGIVNSEQEEERTVAVLFNEMLCILEGNLGMPTAVPKEQVLENSKKILVKMYGSMDKVPADAYRVACIKIYNARVDLRKKYSGSPKQFDAILRNILDDYYYLGYGQPHPNRDVVPNMPKIEKNNKNGLKG